MSNTIDFILPWVDGSDPKWLAEKEEYRKTDSGSSAGPDAYNENRYRDNGLLKYWFRGVEAFAPWVNHVFFVTNAQIPEWLNLDNPKLTHVDHRDYIPRRFLPTFNSCAIELNFHRIKGLSDKFVVFNDDIFLLKPIGEDLFFKEGKPVLDTKMEYPPRKPCYQWGHVLSNEHKMINTCLGKSGALESIWTNRSKWFNIRTLGIKRVCWNLYQLALHRSFPISMFGHLAFPHLKSSLCEIWEKYPDVMSEASSHRFRSDEDVNQWLICAWDQARGSFFPAHKKSLGSAVHYSDYNLQIIMGALKERSVPMICLNESEDSFITDNLTTSVCQAFESILPEKSSFEL